MFAYLSHTTIQVFLEEFVLFVEKILLTARWSFSICLSVSVLSIYLYLIYKTVVGKIPF